MDISNQEIYKILTNCYNEKYEKEKGAVGERAEIILKEVKSLYLSTQLQCLEHIGEHFQSIMPEHENNSSKIVADAVLKDYIFVHLDNNIHKFNLLIFMLQKLFSLVDKTSVPDIPDSLQNQEVLLPGHLITIYLKEKLEDWPQQGKKLLEYTIAKKSETFNLSDIRQVKKVLEKNITAAKQVSGAVENMLISGRLVTKTGLDLPQVRSIGTVDLASHQPSKGRSIRFGEMERDSLLAHGAAYLLHDRLHTCSDYYLADVCTLCGSMLSTTITPPAPRIRKYTGGSGTYPTSGIPPKKKVTCDACQNSKGMETVAMPYVFRYLAAELAAMNIKMTLKLSE